jgi:hypothetical protein
VVGPEEEKGEMIMLDGYKTYLAAFAAFLTALGLFLSKYLNEGVIDPTALITAFIALALLFLRQGIKKEGVK